MSCRSSQVCRLCLICPVSVAFHMCQMCQMFLVFLLSLLYPLFTCPMFTVLSLLLGSFISDDSSVGGSASGVPCMSNVSSLCKMHPEY